MLLHNLELLKNAHRCTKHQFRRHCTMLYTLSLIACLILQNFLKKGSIYLFWHGRLILFTNINILLLVYNDLTYPRYSFQVSVLIVFIESLKFNCQKHKISISWSRPFFNFFFCYFKSHSDLIFSQHWNHCWMPWKLWRILKDSEKYETWVLF